MIRRTPVPTTHVAAAPEPPQPDRQALHGRRPTLAPANRAQEVDHHARGGGAAPLTRLHDRPSTLGEPVAQPVVLCQRRPVGSVRLIGWPTDLPLVVVLVLATP
jgi:hypothetical protein